MVQLLSYNPTDYFYMQAPIDTTNNNKITDTTNLNNTSISNFDNTQTNLNSANRLDLLGPRLSKIICDNINTGASNNEYNKAICQNYTLAQQMAALQSDGLSSDVMYNESKSMYSRELLMTVNLCVGIIGASIFIYFNK